WCCTVYRPARTGTPSRWTTGRPRASRGGSRLRAHDPLLRGCGGPGRKVLDRRRDEVRRELLRDTAQRRVGHDRDLPDVLVVIADEAKVRRHRAEAVPPRERGDLEDEPGEVAGGLDERVDRLRELHEVFFREGRLRPHVQDRAG